jgi:hypothetical protein
MSQRERLLGRRLPPERVTIRVDFSPEADAAYAAYESALRDLEDAESRSVDLADARARVEEALVALTPFREILVVSPVPPSEYEALIGEHPPTEAQQGLNYRWNPDSFVPALLAACIGQELAPEDRMSEKDWLDWTTSAAIGAAGEVNTLFATCLRVNDRSLDVQVGKG